MEKQKKWQIYLIGFVLIISIYNILPNFFYYAGVAGKRQPTEMATCVIQNIGKSLLADQDLSLKYVKVISKHVGLRPSLIQFSQDVPGDVSVYFKKYSDAEALSRVLEHAAPAASYAFLDMRVETIRDQGKNGFEVLIRRHLPITLNKEVIQKNFQFVSSNKDQQEYSQLYKEVVKERIRFVTRKILQKGTANEFDLWKKAKDLHQYSKIFGRDHSILRRQIISWRMSFENLVSLADAMLEKSREFNKEITNHSENMLMFAEGAAFIREFLAAEDSVELLKNVQQPNFLENPDSSKIVCQLYDNHSLFSQVVVDLGKSQLYLRFHDDFVNHKNFPLAQDILTDICRDYSLAIEESFSVEREGFCSCLEDIWVTKEGSIVFDTSSLAEAYKHLCKRIITNEWKPHVSDLSQDRFPILNADDIASFGFKVFLPEEFDLEKPSSFVVVQAKGWGAIRRKYMNLKDDLEKQTFFDDAHRLIELLHDSGFVIEENAEDLVFVKKNVGQEVLKECSEHFQMKAGEKFAFLKVPEGKKHLLNVNEFATKRHESLLQWKDDYQRSLIPGADAYIAPPCINVFWNNWKLNLKKYFLGDERKILKWGLDLSGGKSVRIGLKDRNNKRITAKESLDRACEELTGRLNRLGVAEMDIRTEGSAITIDFPGSQNFSAKDLIQASSLSFHVVNEKFSRFHPELGNAVRFFLHDVWKEAKAQGILASRELGDIACRVLYEGNANKVPYIQRLYDEGLRFAPLDESFATSEFDETFSLPVVLKTDKELLEGENPLVLVFRNYALDGACLRDIQADYEPREGNQLHFGIKKSLRDIDGTQVQPREDFYFWTSQFCEERISGTDKALATSGHGWKMAVVLNDQIISMPSLKSPLHDAARISGRFSFQEIRKLAADLKAGSLSFVPEILSEENISPDLGKAQRYQGLVALVIGFITVSFLMTIYYRFGGMVAVGALAINLLIIAAVLETMGAALTLSGIAGIILALGMSVDANVLIFERIREERALGHSIKTSLDAGYKKACVAIFDSNITTILATGILLVFAGGSVKGFAITLLVGVLSSIFTAFFVTRWFFAWRIDKLTDQDFKMRQWFALAKFDFLRYAFRSWIVVLGIFLVGCTAFLIRTHSSFAGLEFSGGYVLTVNLQEKEQKVDYKEMISKCLKNAGLSSSDFHLRSLNKANRVRIRFGKALDAMSLTTIGANEITPKYAFQSDPALDKAVSILLKGGVEVDQSELKTIHYNWSSMNSYFSKRLFLQSLIGLVVALLGIFVYVTIRFSYGYAYAAVVALFHDVLLTMAIMSIGHLFCKRIQFDMQAVGALLTIIGYSLNDTIVIFDRIREKKNKIGYVKTSMDGLINSSLNETFGRTLMTSATTLVVLLPLLFFGGATLFNSAFIITTGILLGTFSSLFIATPLACRTFSKEESFR